MQRHRHCVGLPCPKNQFMEEKAESQGTKRSWNHSAGTAAAAPAPAPATAEAAAAVSPFQSLEETNLEMDLARHLERSLSQLKEQAIAKYGLDVALLRKHHADRAGCAREGLRTNQLHRQALLSEAILNSESLATAASVERDPQAPDVGGLDSYTRHGAVCHGTVFAPKFRADMAGIMRDECLYLKQSRLAREEAEAEMKKPTKEKGGGSGGGGGGGDSKGGGGSGGKDKQGAAASSGK